MCVCVCVCVCVLSDWEIIIHVNVDQCQMLRRRLKRFNTGIPNMA